MNASEIFSEVSQVRSFESVVSQIQEAIFTGRLVDGDRLASERELCRVFRVSRPTLREALRWLEATGFIEIRLGVQGGIFVTRPDGGHAGSALEALIRFSQATAKELEEFRGSFEGETAYWAAQRASEEDLEDLQSIAGEIEAASSKEDLPWAVISELDLQFHQAIARASKNRVREAIMLGVHNAIRRASLSLDPLMSAEERRSIAYDLASIVAAIEERNPKLARERMQNHVKTYSELEATVLQENGDSDDK